MGIVFADEALYCIIFLHLTEIILIGEQAYANR